jgi:IS1 family transposase
MLDTQALISYHSGMNRLPVEKRAMILSLLCEGSSMRSVSRIVDCSINTVSRELITAGKACAEFHDRAVRNVASKRVQCDEVWSFVGMKEKTAKGHKARPAAVGDVWTWTGIDADSKLIIAWLLGGRDAGAAYEFMTDLASRLANRVQLTTDGHAAYLSAVPGAFGYEVDYAQLVKMYGADANEGAARRYSPPVCLGAEPHRVIGFPDREHISTSYIERSNLTLRMHNRRFTRLTNAFSKKLANHAHMVALYTTWYNFVKLHKTIKVTPAMEAKVTDHLWTMAEIVEIASEWEAKQPHEKVGRKPKAAESN